MGVALSVLIAPFVKVQGTHLMKLNELGAPAAPAACDCNEVCGGANLAAHPQRGASFLAWPYPGSTGGCGSNCNCNCHCPEERPGLPAIPPFPQTPPPTPPPPPPTIPPPPPTPPPPPPLKLSQSC